VETLIENNVKVKIKGDELAKKFQELEKSVQEAHTT
jgi:hypothetical protein